jgi:signal transduction histidine kinase
LASALWPVQALGSSALIVKLLRPFVRHRVARAVTTERARIAREVHDHLAQELAFVRLQSARLAAKDLPESLARELEQIADATEQALQDARRMIGELSGALVDSEPAEPLHVLVGRTAERLAARAGARLMLDLDPRAELPPRARREVVGILRESIWNGIRHGKADAISVVLTCEGGFRLLIADNGTGFDPDAQALGKGAFGLRGMVERAKAGGGELVVRSEIGRGTELEVVLK